MEPQSSVLIATLGGQPQIITFTLDLLLARHEAIDQALVLYLAGSPRYAQAFRRLQAEFDHGQYHGRPLRLSGVPVLLSDTPLAEARTPQEVEAVRAACFTLLGELKAQGRRLHLSLSGGRRVMALTALAAAMQRLDTADRVWHLYTPDATAEAARQSGDMHLPPDSGAALIEVPFVPWAAYFPGLTDLLTAPRPDAPPAWQPPDERRRCETVWRQLSARQRQALERLAAGDTRAQAAAALGVAETTIDSHVKRIYAACREAWPEARIDAAFLRLHFGPFAAGQPD